MKSKMMIVLCVLFSLISVVQAQNIYWVSDGYYQEEPTDQGFVDLLLTNGYNVIRLEDPKVLDQTKVDLMNEEADLVIFGRQANSGDYVNGDETSLWNSITAPLILQNAYMARNSRWRWFNSGDLNQTYSDNMYVVKADDPIFAYLNVLDGNVLDLNNISMDHVSTSEYGNGTLIGRRDGQYPRNWIVRWETGQEFYPSAGQYAGGPRMYFIADELVENYTSVGQAIFLNAVYDMSDAAFNRPPVIIADTEKAAWIGVDMQLSAYVEDDGLPAPSSITYNWTVVSGPGNGTFSAVDIIDPTANFDTVGVYEIQLEVNDGEEIATHAISVLVADPANNKVISHWSMDSIEVIPGALVVDDASDNDGTFVGVIDDPAGSSYIEDPNLFIPGWVGAQAFDTYDNSWIEISAGSDPNAFNVQTGISIAAWVKSDSELLGNYSGIVTKGETAWRLSSAAETIDGSIHFGCSGTSVRIHSERRLDQNWHHIAAVYDAIAEKAYLYIDGVLDTEIDANGLINVSVSPVWIGNNPDMPGRIWDGGIDDVYVYNYGISDQEVQTLASMAPRVPVVIAGDDIDFKRNSEGLTLHGFVYDDGLPQAASISWSVTAKPEGADDPVFADINSPETSVEFNQQGVYQLTLTADDTTASISDIITVTVIDPTCQDVKDAGLIIVADVNQDCYVDLSDFAVIAVSWLECNNPQDSTCPWPFN